MGKKHKRIFIAISKQLKSKEAVRHNLNVLSESAHVSHGENKRHFNVQVLECNLQRQTLVGFPEP